MQVNACRVDGYALNRALCPTHKKDREHARSLSFFYAVRCASRFPWLAVPLFLDKFSPLYYNGNNSISSSYNTNSEVPYEQRKTL